MFHVINALFNTFYEPTLREQSIKMARTQKGTLEKTCPSYVEELHGLSDSLGIPIETLLALQGYLTTMIGGECTVTASTGPATKHNQTYLTQNLDTYSPFNLELYLFRLFFTKNYRVHDVATHYRYVYIGVPLLYEYPLLNEKGLGFGGTGTSITRDKNREIDEGEGIRPYVLVRQTMQSCQNVSEVAYLWKQSTRSSHRLRTSPADWDYDTYIFCDRGGGILIVEQTHSYIMTVFGDSTDITNAPKGILWHSNHHQWLDPAVTGSRYGENYTTSYLREQRALELLMAHYGNITLDVCMDITRDHEGGFDKTKPDSGDICRHPDRHGLWITNFAWIVQPNKYTVYWTRGHPCTSPYTAYNFTELFLE
jgi:hypothetical protein